MLFKKSVMTAAVFAVSSFAVMSANAADSDTFTVTTTIDASCSVDATNADVAFGIIAANTAEAATTITNKPSTSTGIAVTCSNGAPYVIKLTAAGNNTNTAGAGKMVGTNGNTDTITYQLNSMTDTVIAAWGSLDSNDVGGTGIGLSNAVPHLVYASITGSTDVKEDTYTDTITAAITY